jgi:hypothetical protein
MDDNSIVNLNSLLNRLNDHVPDKSEIKYDQRDIRNLEAIFKGVEKALSEFLFGESLILGSVYHTTLIARDFEFPEEAIQNWTSLKSEGLYPNLN